MTDRRTSPGSESSVSILVNGQPMAARRGQTVAAALLANGRRTLRRTAREKTPRGLFCGMGVCYDCLATIDGQPNLRACLAVVREGLQVEIAEP